MTTIKKIWLVQLSTRVKGSNEAWSEPTPLYAEANLSEAQKDCEEENRKAKLRTKDYLECLYSFIEINLYENR